MPLSHFMKRLTKLTYKIYWQHMRQHNIAGFVLIVSVIIASLLNQVGPILYKKFFNIVTGTVAVGNVPAELLSVIVTILMVYLAGWLFWRISGFVNSYYQTTLMTELANTCFGYLHKHSFSFFQNHFVGSLVKRVNRFYRSFEGIADIITWELVPMLTSIAAIIVVLFFEHPIFSVSIFGWVIIIFLLNYAFSRYKLKYDFERSRLDSKVTGVLADTITNHSNVKLFTGYEREKKSFADVTETLRKLRKFTWDLSTAFEAVQILLMIFLEFGIFYIAIDLWTKGIITVGDFVLLQAYLLTIFHQLWDVGKMIRHYYERIADAEEMAEIFDTPHEIVDSRRAKPLVIKKGKIEFDHVDFRYNKTRQVISDFSLKISAGSRLAFVGHSGAGKSTIVKLLLRIHDVTRGKVFIDGQRISQVTLESLRSQLSYVPQDAILFHRTLMENIRYGNPDATDEEVIAAAKAAHCHEFISSFPDGYDTYVGERGVKLSGGERQRVSIARAMLKNAPILILDEATSSLDSESEGFIQDALDKLMKGKTVIVIAHRLSTIMKMDRIIVMEDGKIIEDGSHKELLKKKKGTYKKLWELQAGGFL